MSTYVLCDIPSKGRRACCSLNTWKTRMVLNYKELDYETHWVEYPDIEATLSPHVEANVCKVKGDTPYSVPATQHTDGTWIMDSRKIAERLEKDHPSPSLHLEDPILPEVEEMLKKVKEPLIGVWLPKVPFNLLNDPSKAYFIKTREAGFGMSLEQISTEQGGEEAWIEALPGLKGFGEILKRNGGPFFLGTDVSYADFVVVGFLHFVKVIDEDIYQKIIKIEPVLETLYEASKQWVERDSS